MSLGDFVQRCEPYFAGAGQMIDQPYQERLPEGMIRCYLVRERVVGFGHQATNALVPPPPGVPPTAAPQPGPRLYHPPDKPEFQHLKHQLQQHWVPAIAAHWTLIRATCRCSGTPIFFSDPRPPTETTPTCSARSTSAPSSPFPTPRCPPWPRPWRNKWTCPKREEDRG